MEKTPTFENNLDDKSEKSKKSKKFLKYLSKFLNSEKTDDNNTEENEKPQRNIIDIIRDFLSKEDKDDEDVNLDEYFIDSDEEELASIDEYLSDNLDINLNILNTKEISDIQKKDLLVETVILSKIKEHINNNEDIDVEKIIEETTREIEVTLAVSKNNQEINYDREKTSHNQEIVNGKISKNESKTKSDKKNSDKSDEPKEEITKIPPKEDEPQDHDNYLNTLNNRLTFNNNITDRTIQKRPNIVTNKLDNDPVHKKPEFIRKDHVQELHKAKYPNSIVEIPKQHDINNFKKVILPELTKTDSPIIRPEQIQNNIILDSEILRQAEKTFLDKVSLKKIYENSDLSINDLRKILSGESKKKSVRKEVKRALQRRNNSYADIVSGIRGTKSRISNNKVESKPKPKIIHKINRSKSSNAVTENKSIDNSQSNIIPRPELALIIFIILCIIGLVFLLFKHNY